jgi:hypothetical protein
MAANREHEHQDAPLAKPEIQHDDREIDIKAIGTFGIALVLICIATFALLLGIFHYFKTREDASQTASRPGVDPGAHRMPPLPRLQSEPVPDLKAVRDAEEKILHSYAWADQPKGLVRIPIEQAIDLLAQRGLPSRPSQPATTGASVPTEAGLGTIVDVTAEPAAAAPSGSGAQH